MRKAILAALFALFASLTALAQVDNTHDRGFNAETAYHIGEFDSVNAMNGNLSVTVPLGQTYQSTGTLAYTFTLTYNSHFWDYVMHSDDDFSPYRFLVPTVGPVQLRTAAEMARLSPFSPLTPDNQNRDQVESNLSGVEAFPAPVMNAGLGWMVTLGELENGIVYVSPDGSRHEFFLNHHSVTRTGVNVSGLTASRINEILGAADIFYTRDGSFLRMLVYPAQSGVFRREVQFPDGIKNTYTCAGTAQVCGNFEESRWYLESIRDPYGNALTVSRPVQPLAGDWPWTYIETSNGVEVRRHTLNFHLIQRDGGRTEMRLRSAVLAAVGGSATYNLQYQDGSVFRERGSGWHALHEDDHVRAPLNASGKIAISFLERLELPLSAGNWQFTYDHDLVDDTVSQGPEGTYWGISERDGYLHAVTVPAGATATYEYEPRIIPTGGCGPTPAGDGPRPVQAVSKRRLNVDGEVSEWRYSHYWLPRALNPLPCPAPRELITAVVDPYSTVSLSYFSVYRTEVAYLDENPGPNGYLSKEYGLPFTRIDPADGKGRFLSSETYQCTAADFQSGGALADNPGRILPRYRFGNPAPNCSLKKQRYVKYEYGSVDCSLGTTGNDCVASNPRVQSEATYWVDGSGAMTSVDSEGWDGLGHYRTQKSGGNLHFLTFGDVPAPAENDDSKTVTRQYNDGTSYFANDTVDETTRQRIESSSAPWMLETYPWETTSQWVLDPKTGVRLKQTSKSELWFDANSGQIKRARKLASLAADNPPQSESDVIVDYVRTSTGARATLTESHFGGDTGRAPLGELSGLQLTTPDYQIRKGLYAGGVENTTYPDCNTDFLRVHSDVVDARTGLSLSTQDAAAATTSFGYDALGRMTSITPPGETALIYTYAPRSGSIGPKVNMTRDAAPLKDAAEWRYDGLGRLVTELHWVPDQNDYGATAIGSMNQKDVTYDRLGRRETESAVRKSGDASPGETHFTYDLFGRVTSRRYQRPNPNPDYTDPVIESETTFQYAGPWRVIETERLIQTGRSRSTAPS